MTWGSVVTSPCIDQTSPNEARIVDYLLGGKDNFAADREAAHKVLELAPELVLILREWQECTRRVVRFLVDRGSASSSTSKIVSQLSGPWPRWPSVSSQVIETDSTQDNIWTRAEVERLFCGLELVEPGLVLLSQWRPEPCTEIENPEKLWAVAGVSRKPALG